METTIISILTYILEACIELLLIRSLLHRKWKDMFSFYLFLLPVCGILDYCFYALLMFLDGLLPFQFASYPTNLFYPFPFLIVFFLI